ncbi:MAG: OmpA family protein [Cyclobacteriaceae bacterium]|nr:OmpA family protein [Cyclobacteriaceae bacterium]
MRWLLIFLLLFLSVQLYAQEEYSVDNPRIKKWYESARQLIKEREFDGGISLYKKCLVKEPTFVEAHWALASIFKNLGDLERSFYHLDQYYLGADKSGISVPKLMILVKAYFKNGFYGKAKACLDQIQLYQIPADQDDSLLIASVAYAYKNQKTKAGVMPKALPSSVNRYLTQYFPTLTIDNNTLIFTKRAGASGSYDEDLVVSYREAGIWSPATLLSNNIHSEFNEGAASISADGRTLIFTMCDKGQTFGNCDLFISRKYGEVWSNPENLGKVVNSKNWDSQPSLGADGNILYFSSDRSGGMGKRDIWYTQRVDNTWIQPKNMGNIINTLKDDVTPFIHTNGENLVFASNGRVGFGGYDLYVSEQKEGKWQTPRNLGNAVNNNLDQLSFIISADGSMAYFSQDFKKADGKLKTKIVQLPIINDSLVKNTSSYIFGRVRDAISQKAIKAKIELFDIFTNKLKYSTYSDSISGEYFFALNEGLSYGVYAGAKGYFFEDFRFDIQNSSSGQPDTLDIILSPLEVGATMILENIYFDLASYELTLNSQSELEIVAEFLVENQVNIQIEGHTDQSGDPQYNQMLSEQRAKAVYDFLIASGIPSDQLTFIGLGSKHPVESDPTLSDQNRRIEFRIRSEN